MNRKRVQRLMRVMEIRRSAQAKDKQPRAPGHRIYPKDITRNNCYAFTGCCDVGCRGLMV